MQFIHTLSLSGSGSPRGRPGRRRECPPHLPAPPGSSSRPLAESRPAASDRQRAEAVLGAVSVELRRWPRSVRPRRRPAPGPPAAPTARAFLVAREAAEERPLRAGEGQGASRVQLRALLRRGCNEACIMIGLYCARLLALLVLALCAAGADAVCKDRQRGIKWLENLHLPPPPLPGWDLTKNLTGYYSGDPCFPASWPRVSCNAAGCISGLDLSNLTLNSPLPANVFELPTLEVLKASSCGLTSMSDAMANVAQAQALQNLDLSSNSFTNEPIPDLLWRLPNLARVDLSSSSLVGTIPSTIGIASKLTFLSIASTSISGPIPTSIGDLTLLKVFNLSRSFLGGNLPSSLSKLVNLQYLNLNKDCAYDSQYSPECRNITTPGGTFPSWIGLMTALTLLDFGGMKNFVDLSPELTKLTGLQFLDVSKNSIRLAIPSWLGNISSLTHLDLSENSLNQSIPTSIALLTNLKWLSLQTNKLTGFTSGLGKLTNLNRLELEINSFDSSIPTEIGQLVALKYLDLGICSFIGTIPTELGELVHLEYLYLGYNSLQSKIPPEFGKLSQLTNLNIAQAGIYGTLPSALANMTSMVYLDAQFNRLSGELPEWIGSSWAQLTLLNVASNSLSGPIPSSLSLLTEKFMINIVLSNNQFTGTIPASLGNITASIFLLLAQNNDLSGAIPSSLCRLAEDKSRVLALTVTNNDKMCKPKCLDDLVVGPPICGMNTTTLSQGYLTWSQFTDEHCSNPIASTIFQLGDPAHCTLFSGIFVRDERLVAFKLKLTNGTAGAAIVLSGYNSPDCQSPNPDATYYFRNIGPSHFKFGNCIRMKRQIGTGFCQSDSTCGAGDKGGGGYASLRPTYDWLFSYNKSSGPHMEIEPRSFMLKYTDAMDGFDNPQDDLQLWDLNRWQDSANASSFAVRNYYENQFYGSSSPVRALITTLGQCIHDNKIGSESAPFNIVDLPCKEPACRSHAFYCKSGTVHRIASPISTGCCEGRNDSACTEKMLAKPLPANSSQALLMNNWADYSDPANKFWTWKCTEPKPAPPKSGVITIISFPGTTCSKSNALSSSVCGGSAVMVSNNTENGFCYQINRHPVQSYREHYFDPGLWGSFSIDIVRTTFKSSNCSGPGNTTTQTRVKDACTKGVSGSTLLSFISESNSELRQQMLDGNITACALSHDAHERSSNCSSIVGGSGRIGEMLIDDKAGARFVVKTVYSGSVCNGAAIVEETFRVGDQSLCFPDGAKSLKRLLSASNCGSTDIITLHYKNSKCDGQPDSYDSALAGEAQKRAECFTGTSSAGGSYTLVLSESSTIPSVSSALQFGYVENIFLGDTCGDTSSPAIRRAYANSACVGGYSFSCRRSVTVSYDRVSDATAFASPRCGASGPIKTTLFASSRNPTSYCKQRVYYGISDWSSLVSNLPQGQLPVTSKYYESISCLSPPSAEFELQLRDQKKQWALTVAVGTLSLAGGLLVLGIIGVMALKRRLLDSVRVVAIVTFFQLVYDLSFILPMQSADEAPSSEYIQAATRAVFLSRWFCLACLLMTNLLAASVCFIVIAKRSIPLNRILPSFTALVLVASVVPAVLLTVYADRIAHGSEKGPEYENAQKKSFSDTLITLRSFQMGSILGNVLIIAVTALNILRTSTIRMGIKSASQSPLIIVCVRLGVYPVVQVFSQAPVIWDTFAFQLNNQLNGPRTDDDFFLNPDSPLHYRAYAYFNAVLAPISGLLFAVAFVWFQPGAWKIINAAWRAGIGASAVDETTRLPSRPQTKPPSKTQGQSESASRKTESQLPDLQQQQQQQEQAKEQLQEEQPQLRDLDDEVLIELYRQSEQLASPAGADAGAAAEASGQRLENIYTRGLELELTRLSAASGSALALSAVARSIDEIPLPLRHTLAFTSNPLIREGGGDAAPAHNNARLNPE